jgi:hypothetical protein
MLLWGLASVTFSGVTLRNPAALEVDPNDALTRRRAVGFGLWPSIILYPNSTVRTGHLWFLNSSERNQLGVCSCWISWPLFTTSCPPPPLSLCACVCVCVCVCVCARTRASLLHKKWRKGTVQLPPTPSLLYNPAFRRWRNMERYDGGTAQHQHKKSLCVSPYHQESEFAGLAGDHEWDYQLLLLARVLQ